jgi:hypothetical protein
MSRNITYKYPNKVTPEDTAPISALETESHASLHVGDVLVVPQAVNQQDHGGIAPKSVRDLVLGLAVSELGPVQMQHVWKVKGGDLLPGVLDGFRPEPLFIKS